MSTRPKITFDARVWCNACVWSETQTVLDWDTRHHELTALPNNNRRSNDTFDCPVPVSSSKYGNYVT